MKKLNILFGLLVVALATVFIYSCAKDTDKSNIETNTVVETRGGSDLLDLLGTACVPSSINIGGGCNDTTFVDTAIITNHPMYPGCNLKLFINDNNVSLDS